MFTEIGISFEANYLSKNVLSKYNILYEYTSCAIECLRYNKTKDLEKILATQNSIFISKETNFNYIYLSKEVA